MPSLQGKTVFITGTSSGIGRSTAIAFARQGSRLSSPRSMDAQEKRLEVNGPTQFGELLFDIGERNGERGPSVRA